MAAAAATAAAAAGCGGDEPDGGGSRYVHRLHTGNPQISRDHDHDTTTTGSGGTDPSANCCQRGRPTVSMNKSRAPLIVSGDSANAFHTHVLEVSAGSDIVDCISVYARRRSRGICILSGGGTVTNVTLRRPPASPSGDVVNVNLLGSFQILTVSGTVLPPPAPPGVGGLSIFLSGAQGQLVGGTVVGPLIASGPVILMATSFGNALFDHLPLEGEEEDGGSGSRGGGTQQVRPTASQSSGVAGGGGGGGSHMAEVGRSGGGTAAFFNNNNNTATTPTGGSARNYPLSAGFTPWRGRGGRGLSSRPPF